MVEQFAGREGTYGLILAPTREIAQQTQAVLELFGTPRGVRSAVLIGGVDMRYDTQALATYPQIIVATPGRLCDHLDRGNIWLDFIQTVVLDEADRMLDMGFADQLARIMQDLPENRQTMIFSATFSPPVEALARRNMYQPHRVAIGKPSTSASTVEQRLIFLSESKTRELDRLLREETGTIIVFARSKDGASRLWRSLHSRGFYDSTVIHSDCRQQDRERSLAQFKDGTYRILVATDVAGRGIHVDAVAHVINYDLPMKAEDYIHRIGRTGRQGATGKATSFVTPRDRRLLHDIERLLGKKIPTEFGQPMEASSRPQRASGQRTESKPHADAARGASSAGGERGANPGNKRRRRRRGGRGGRGGGPSGGAKPTS